MDGENPLTNWDDPPSSDAQVCQPCQPLGCSKYSSTRPACFDAVFVGRGGVFSIFVPRFLVLFSSPKKPPPNPPEEQYHFDAFFRVVENTQP